MKALFGRKPQQENAAALYGAVMAAARRPEFVEKFGLPDTFATRFELLTLHMFLALHRLKAEGAAGQGPMQALTERMVEDLDRSLRELGVGDMGMARRMKKMMSGFYGRVLAYEKAVEAGDEEALRRALARNLFAECHPSVDALREAGDYVTRRGRTLRSCPVESLLQGGGFAEEM